MTIPAKEIVNVTPNVLNAGGSALDLSGMVLTDSTRVPIGTIQSFSTPDAVGTYFGASSVEKTKADVYFLGYDNSFAKPGAMLFTQYPKAAVAAFLRGGNISSMTLAQLQAINDNLTITIDGYARTAAVNLGAATSFSSAAGIIQTAINGSLATEASITGSIAATTLTVTAVGSGTLAVGQTLLGAGITAGTIITALGTGVGGTGTYTLNNSQAISSEAMTTEPTPVAVTYDSVSGAFVITSGITGVASLAAFATNTIAATLLLTSATGAVISQGAAAAVPATFMDALTLVSQNWASFFTTFNPDSSGNAVKLAFAAWNNSQNNRYVYVCWDTDASPTTANPATSSLGHLIAQAAYSGIELIYEPSNTYNLEAFVSGSIASIDFERTNGRTTFAFRKQDGLTPSVVDVSVANNLKGNGYNFYGSYATAAQDFQFYNPGSISGPFSWLDSFIDQIWLNNAFQLALMELLVNVPSIPYNSAGAALIESALQDPIDAGLNFGAFRPGITLSNAQIAEVNNAAGKDIAGTLQTRGWYLQVTMPSALVRAARGSPICTFWYVDGQSVQKIDLTSIELQ